MKFTTCLVLFLSVSAHILSAQQNSPQQGNQGQSEDFEIMMERMIQNLSHSLDTMDLNRFFSESFGSMHMQIDTNMMNELFGRGYMNMFDEDPASGMGGAGFDQLIEQGIQMLQSMDEKQLESLLNQLDFSQMEYFFEGMDMSRLDSLMQDFNLQIPENFLDSLQDYQDMPLEKRKKLKRI